MTDLTIIIPCYNEEQGIKNTLTELLFFKTGLNFRILVINDASEDETPSILQKFKNDIDIINHKVNKGYGASLKTGINNCDTKLIAFYDADGQHKPKDLFKMFSAMEDHDMLIGARNKDSHQDLIRKPGKWVLGKVANYLTGRRIPDLNSGLRIIQREKINKLLHLFPDGFSFSTTSTIAFMYLSFKVKYIPIKVEKRIGKSTVRQLKHGSSTLLLILRLIVLFNPLKVFLPVSFWMIFFGVVYELVFGIFLLYPQVKLIAAAFFLILTGILTFFFGLIADQISAMRIHDTRER
jgi:glycosyltransferase involved in cell wall biosynthesis